MRRSGEPDLEAGFMAGPLTEVPTIRMLCWNMGAGGPGQRASWSDVTSASDYDVAMLQEAPNPWRTAVDVDMVPSPGSKWGIGSNWAQTAIARLSNRVEITPLAMQPLGLDGPLQLGISRPGTVSVASSRCSTPTRRSCWRRCTHNGKDRSLAVRGSSPTLPSSHHVGPLTVVVMAGAPHRRRG